VVVEPAEREPEAPAPPAHTRARLPATVISLGFASLFNDMGSEMAFPLLGVFLVSLGAGPAALGLIEGIADATASGFKLIAGYAADRCARLKPLVLFGYGLATIARPFLAVASVPLHVLGIRLTDRVGKGLRTAPRDLLIAGCVDSGQSGRAFGFHRAMDHAGGMLGPLLAGALLALGFSMREVFLFALAPSLLSLLAVARVREHARPLAQAKAQAPTEKPALPRKFTSYLAILSVFALANSSDAFLLLRANEVAGSLGSLPLLWTLLHASRALCTVLGGRLADRFSRPRLVALGWVVFALCYFGLGQARDTWQVWALFAVYGLQSGLCEPAERALVRDLAPPSARGRAFGLFHGVIGACAIPAGLLTGWLWQTWSASLALGVSAVLALAAAAALVLWERSARSLLPAARAV
jgi:MFS family permease